MIAAILRDILFLHYPYIMSDLDAIRWVGICGKGFVFDADVDELSQQCMEKFAENFEDRGLGVFHGANVGDTRARATRQIR